MKTGDAIAGLEICVRDKKHRSCDGCPYRNKPYCMFKLMRDVYGLVELLAKDIPESVPPSVKKTMVRSMDGRSEVFGVYSCGDCGQFLYRMDNYCATCGRKVDWSEKRATTEDNPGT